ncbi:uncharacterized protein EAE98_004007 [Botrytis deweyae]|uniref:N-acetyltransferase domain-containing protein n=1 Tax=Botrytis deweyae TaxID=2478750 RepID=A0ABQ7ISB6_9HELO|nr:uncharacterized protein EAE98_004007 [Botrytis deweyae]KAF7932708.1 hypothetical protein EAE98_004007 [Botrytis deweyae]
MFLEFASTTSTCKLRVFSKKEKYYYIFFLGTAASARGQGLCSKMVKHDQSIAAKEGLPIWLEAATEYAFKVYLELRFVLIEEMKFG